MRYLIIACSKSKQKSQSPTWAAHYYTGTLFKKLFQYATTNRYSVLILSAKYNVLRPSDLICPYDENLYSFKSEQLKVWQQETNKQLAKIIQPFDEVIICLPVKYKTNLNFVTEKITEIGKDFRLGPKLKLLNKLNKGKQ